MMRQPVRSVIVLGLTGLVITISSCSNAPRMRMTDRDAPLTSVPGDPVRGQAAFEDRERGHCLLCHALAASAEPFQGNIGPPLDGIGKRLDAAQIRYRIVDASRLNSQTLMPPYHRTQQLSQVAKAHRGQPVLSRQEVEDVVAYLKEMK